MCGALAFVDDGSASDTRVLVALSLVSLILVGGALRFLSNGVTVTADGLTVRELFRTTRLPWSHLRAIDVIARRTYTYGHRRAEVADVERGGPNGVIRDPLALQLGKAIFYPRIHYAAPGKGRRQTVTINCLGAYRREVAQRRADELRELMRSHGDQHL